MSAPQWPGPPDQPASIDQYAPPRRRAVRVVVLLLVVVVVAAIGVTAWRVSRATELPLLISTPSATPIATPRTPATPVPAATAAASSIPFVAGAGQAKGQWTITKVSWSAAGVTLSMRIRVTEGALIGYSFYLMENESADVHEPQSQGWPDDISNGTIQAGETVTGRVFIPCPQVDSTIMLIQGNGTDPVAALTIAA